MVQVTQMLYCFRGRLSSICLADVVDLDHACSQLHPRAAIQQSKGIMTLPGCKPEYFSHKFC